ncbi:UNVERIFIED_CONTAM: hypothetical protein FKN15_055119, partial [Acipenser sinensis]
KRDNELLLKLIANLNMLLKDESVNVVKKVILTMTHLYKVALQWMVRLKGISDIQEACWEMVTTMKDEIILMLDSENDGIRTHAIKFVESLIITLSPRTSDSKVPKRQENDISLERIPKDHAYIRHNSLGQEGKMALEQLLKYMVHPAISSINLTAALGSLATIARQRPMFMSEVIQAYETLHGKTSGVGGRKKVFRLADVIQPLSETQVEKLTCMSVKRILQSEKAISRSGMSHTRVCLGMTTLRDLIFKRPSRQFQYLHLLLDLSSHEKDKCSTVRRVRDLYHKRVPHVHFLIPVLNGEACEGPVSQESPARALPHPSAQRCGEGEGSSTVSPLTPGELLMSLHNIDTTRCDMKSIIKATKLCFAERNVYTSEVLAVVMQRLMEQSPLPMLLMRTVIQSLTMYPRLGGFVMNILSLLIIKQVWKYPKVWEGFIKCCQRTKPQSFAVLQQLPPPQLSSVFDKCPELRDPLLVHVHSFTPHQQSSSSSRSARVEQMKLAKEATKEEVAMKPESVLIKRRVSTLSMGQAISVLGAYSGKPEEEEQPLAKRRPEPILPTALTKTSGVGGRKKVFRLADVIQPLSETQVEKLTCMSVKRILQSEKAISRSGMSHVRVKILSRLVTQFEGSMTAEVLDFVLEDIRNRSDLAFALLYQEYNAYLSDCPSGSLDRYDECLIGLLSGLQEKPDQRDGLFTKLVLEAPLITETALEVICRCCEDETRVCLGMTTLRDLIFKRPSRQFQYLHLLLDLSSHEKDKCSTVRRVRDLYHKRVPDVRFLIPVLNGEACEGPVSQESPARALPHPSAQRESRTCAPSSQCSTVRRVRDLYHKRVPHVRSLIPVLNGEACEGPVSQESPARALPHPSAQRESRTCAPSSQCSTVRRVRDLYHKRVPHVRSLIPVLNATNLCFAEKNVYTSEVLAVVMQRLMEQSPLPMLLMRTVIQSLTMYPHLGGFVMNILSLLIIKQVWKYPKVWEGFIKCCQRTKPQSFAVLLQLPPPQLSSVFDKCPELRDPLLVHVHSFTPHQQAHVPRSIMTVLEANLKPDPEPPEPKEHDEEAMEQGEGGDLTEGL